MPNELNTTGKWRLEILAIFPMKENVVYSTTYQRRLGVAYIKVRLKALLKDWSTSGEYYGVGWRIKKES
ncbi:hypothetical protein AT268_33265 [Bacillus cereus]|uniref:Uncharacterized protein n=2 Tax=Bacillaceae TaxID=186817 RepID=A0A9X0MKQ6_BACCE|nr:hypothetical protein AT268_33265 [Bacillus cereus]PEZ75430.1 hypothetical protein CN410_12270 [Bacillus anthracis]PFA29869.1 hypothetical protein CN384_08385 [Bacillus thuringiensis]PGW11089.1 hypothetical protein COD97_15840 [Bacillus cereus]